MLMNSPMINRAYLTDGSPLLRDLYENVGFRDWIGKVTNVELMDCAELAGDFSLQPGR